MFELISNFLKKIGGFIGKHKKELTFLIIGLFLILTPTCSAAEEVTWWYDEIVEDWGTLMDNISSTMGILNIVTSLPFNLIILIYIGGALLTILIWAIEGIFVYAILTMLVRALIDYSLSVGVSPSNPLTPVIVTTGWEFTSGFVNMFFVLTLTFIGLATILRLKDYEAKKILPKILLIAVLVNFTPVIIGFIVDMGNLVTNFFIKQTTWIDIGTFITETLGLFNLEDIFETMASSITENSITFLFNMIGTMIGVLIPLIYVYAAIYIYFCITGMFFLRVVMLWVLTILSPIAFFSYIFPSGPLKILFPDILGWEKWWEEFLKWVVVGIPFGLFLYISQEMLKGDVGFTVPLTSGESTYKNINIGELIELLTEATAQVASLLMLHVGYKISLNAAPAMAKSMIESTDKALKAVAMTVATAGIGAAAGAGAGTMGNIAGKLGAKGASMVAKGGRIRGRIGKGLGGLSKAARQGQTGLNRAAVKFKPKLPKEASEFNDQQLIDGSKGAKGRTKAEWLSKVKDWNSVSDEEKADLAPEMEAMMQNENIMGEYKGTFKNMHNGGVSSEDIRTGLSDNPAEAKKAIDGGVEEMENEMNNNEKFRINIDAEINAKYNNNASNEDREQFKRNFAVEVLDFVDLSEKNRASLSEKKILSSSSVFGSRKLGIRALNGIRSSQKEGVAEKMRDSAGGINSVSLEEMYKTNPTLARELLNGKQGKTWEWKAGTNLDPKYEGKPGVADMKKVKAYMTTVSPNTPKGIYIDPTEINAKRNSVALNTAMRDKALKEAGAAGITDPTKRGEFMNKWYSAEAGRQVIKEKQGVKEKLVGTDQLKVFKKSLGKVRAHRIKGKESKKVRMEEKVKKSKTRLGKSFNKKRIDIINSHIKSIEDKISKKISMKGSKKQKGTLDIIHRNKEIKEQLKTLKHTASRIEDYEQKIKTMDNNLQNISDLNEQQIIKVKIAAAKTMAENDKTLYMTQEGNTLTKLKEMAEKMNDL